MCGMYGAVAGGIESGINIAAEEQAAGQNKQIIDAASVGRQHEISEQGSLQENETMMQARAERAHSIAAASGSHINLASGSFLASLQQTTMASGNKRQVELENEQNQQLDNTIKTQSELNSKATTPTFLGGATQVIFAMVSGFMGQMQSYQGNQTGGADTSGAGSSNGSSDGSINTTGGDGIYTGSGAGDADMSAGSIGSMSASGNEDAENA